MFTGSLCGHDVFRPCTPHFLNCGSKRRGRRVLPHARDDRRSPRVSAALVPQRCSAPEHGLGVGRGNGQRLVGRRFCAPVAPQRAVAHGSGRQHVRGAVTPRLQVAWTAADTFTQMVLQMTKRSIQVQQRRGGAVATGITFACGGPQGCCCVPRRVHRTQRRIGG